MKNIFARAKKIVRVDFGLLNRHLHWFILRLSTMSFVKKPTQGPEPGFHKIRITLNSTNVKNLEKVCADLVRGAHEQRLLKVKG